MSQELHYTSSPRGLKSGSRGFCTVACTAGLSPTLAERLEGLSGYRPKYPPHHPEAAQNPVNWSHLRLSAAGLTVSVLGRVGPAGLDYTDRPNKYAHHVVLESGERVVGGPAWLLTQPGFMESAWAGTPQILPAGRRPPTGDRPVSVCRAWAERVGDAGWAGVLVESFLADPKRPAIFVYDPGTDVLGLFVEALALLPADRRWEVTFSTFYTGLPAGTTCTWRGVLRDSPEERQARANPEALILDLGQALGLAQGGALVNAARTGAPVETLPPSPQAAPPPSGLPLSSSPRQSHSPSRQATSVPASTQLSEEPAYAPEVIAEYPIAPPPLAAKAQVRPPATIVSQTRRPLWPLVTAVSAAFLVGIALGSAGVAYLLAGPPDAPAVALAPKATEPKVKGPSTEKEKPGSVSATQPDSKKADPDNRNLGEASATKTTSVQNQQKTTPSRVAVQTTDVIASSEHTSIKKTDDIRTHAEKGIQNQPPPSEPGESDNRAEIVSKPAKPTPPAAGGLSPPASVVSTPEELASTDLSLIPTRVFPLRLGNPDPNFGGSPPAVSIDGTVRSLALIGLNERAIARYELNAEMPQGMISLVVFCGKKLKENELAIFKWEPEKQQVSFTWSIASQTMENTRKEALRDCILKIEESNNISEYFILRDLKSIRPLQTLGAITKNNSNQTPIGLEILLPWCRDETKDATGLNNSELRPYLAALKFSGANPAEVLNPDQGNTGSLVTSDRIVSACIPIAKKGNALLGKIQIHLNGILYSDNEIKKLEEQRNHLVSQEKSDPDAHRKQSIYTYDNMISQYKKFAERVEKITHSQIEATIAVKVGGQNFMLPIPKREQAGAKGGAH